MPIKSVCAPAHTHTHKKTASHELIVTQTYSAVNLLEDKEHGFKHICKNDQSNNPPYPLFFLLLLFSPISFVKFFYGSVESAAVDRP